MFDKLDDMLIHYEELMLMVAGHIFHFPLWLRTWFS